MWTFVEIRETTKNRISTITRTFAIGIVAFLIFYRPSGLEVHVPSVECEDGSKVSPLSITFTHSNGW